MTQEIIAKLKHLRLPPRKTRAVADTIRGLTVNEAETQLVFSARRAGSSLLKLLNSAIANAKHNYQLDPDKLYVKAIRVDQGPKSKRWTPRARGAVNVIERKTSHVTLVLGVSDRLKPPKFIIPKISKKAKVKKEKEEKKKDQKLKDIKPVLEKKTSPKTGFFKRIFRRKSI